MSFTIRNRHGNLIFLVISIPNKAKGCSSNPIVINYFKREDVIIFLNAASDPKQLELGESDKNIFSLDYDIINSDRF